MAKVRADKKKVRADKKPLIPTTKRSSMAEKPKSDVRTAIEWAWTEYDNCVLRDQNKIPVGMDFDKRSTQAPPGGQQFLDLAYTNRVAFYKDFVMKALGADLDEEDETALKEKKSIADMQKLLKRFENAGKKVT